MDTPQQASVIKWSAVGLILTVNIAVGCLGALVLLLHDGAATASVVDTLKWIATTGIIALTGLLGVHTWVSGGQSLPTAPVMPSFPALPSAYAPAVQPTAPTVAQPTPQPTQATPGAVVSQPLPAGLPDAPTSP